MLPWAHGHIPFVWKTSLCAGFLLTVVGCLQRTFNSTNDSVEQSIETVEFDREQLLRKHRFDGITPTGEKIFAASLGWQLGQESAASQFALPAQSANNVSRIFEMAGISEYSSPFFVDIVNSARKRGGWVIALPKESASIARLIEQYFNGALPVGTLVSGCSNSDCSGDAGDASLSIVGEVDANDHLMLHHNNGYRPENRPWRPHMIPLLWFQRGYARKWMAIPWISRQRDSLGALTRVEPVIPELDELDPNRQFVTLTVIPEILQEMDRGQFVVTDGNGAVMPSRRRQNISSAVSISPSQSFASCSKLKTIFTSATYLHDEPRGTVFCKLATGSPVERLSNSGHWTQVRGMCPDGRFLTGFVLSSRVTPACE